MQFQTPILFLIYNRPDTTKMVFEKIREIKPSKLFIAADGPRHHKVGEKEKCDAVRQLVLDGVDWACEVKTLFRNENLGCGKAVSSAITWFFDNAEEGIILEDDTLPDKSFFTFCETLLEKYRHVDAVKMISGNNFQRGRQRSDGSYYFSAYSHIWGWATWKRTWEVYNFDLDNFTDDEFDSCLDYYFKTKKIKTHWRSVFERVRKNEIDTWDYQLLFSIWKKRGNSILPNQNLVTNIGFGEQATHTTDVKSFSANLPVNHITEIIHPSVIEINKKADLFYDDNYIFSRRPPLIMRAAKKMYRIAKGRAHLPTNKFYPGSEKLSD